MDALSYIIGLFLSAIEDFIRVFADLITYTAITPGGGWDIEFRPQVIIAALILAVIAAVWMVRKYFQNK